MVLISVVLEWYWESPFLYKKQHKNRFKSYFRNSFLKKSEEKQGHF